jgi:hypothetical protein
MRDGRTARRKWEVELLEARRLLAGNMRVEAEHGDLEIRGDRFDNCIEITQDAMTHEITVTGCNDAHGNPTSINGAPNGSFTTGGSVFTMDTFSDEEDFFGEGDVTDDIRINMRGGDDSVLISGGVDVPDDLSIETGSGDDTVDLDDVIVGDDLRVETGSGNDHVDAEALTVNDRVHVELGSGNDALCVGDHSSFQGRVEAEGDSGHDTIFDDGTTVFGSRPHIHSFEQTASSCPFGDLEKLGAV